MVSPHDRATPPVCPSACVSGLITIFHVCASLLEEGFLWRHPRPERGTLDLEQVLEAG